MSEYQAVAIGVEQLRLAAERASACWIQIEAKLGIAARDAAWADVFVRPAQALFDLGPRRQIDAACPNRDGWRRRTGPLVPAAIDLHQGAWKVLRVRPEHALDEALDVGVRDADELVAAVTKHTQQLAWSTISERVVVVQEDRAATVAFAPRARQEQACRASEHAAGHTHARPLAQLLLGLVDVDETTLAIADERDGCPSPRIAERCDDRARGSLSTKRAGTTA
jgi:hypothetical protein